MTDYSLIISPGFMACAAELSKDEKSKLIKCLKLLSENVRHPGLQTKKIHGNAKTLFECRIDKSIRLIYDVYSENIRCWYVGSHDIALKYGERQAKSSTNISVDDIALTNIPQIAIEVTADYIINGTVRTDFNTIRVNDLANKFA